jgi:hypothetical protein
MKYQGSCHCGNIAFEAEGEIGQVLDCNCSMCMRRGGLLWFLKPESFHLKTPRENVSTYQFNKHVIEHHFCAKCGIAPFGEGTDPKGNRMVAVNARCLEGFDPQTAQITHFDGRKY